MLKFPRPETGIDYDRKNYIDGLITDQYFLAKNTADTQLKTPTHTKNKLLPKPKLGKNKQKPENKNIKPKISKTATVPIITALSVVNMPNNLRAKFPS